MTLSWFCKHCQTSGTASVEGELSAQEVFRRIVEDHEQTRKLGGEPWILLNLENNGTIRIEDDPATIIVTTPVLPHPCISFLVLHE